MHHLAQLNIGKLKYPLEHPAVAEFVDNLQQINRLAESSPGFVWRLKEDNGNATHIQAFHDPLIIINMSVWENVEALKSFVYTSQHVDFLRKKTNWFEKLPTAYMVMWWIKAGYIPNLEEALERLNQLNEAGENAHAFTFRQVFQPISQ